MTIYRRPTNTELEAMPPELRTVMRALRDYLDAATANVEPEQLEMLGWILELEIARSESEQSISCAALPNQRLNNLAPARDLVQPQGRP